MKLKKILFGVVILLIFIGVILNITLTSDNNRPLIDSEMQSVPSPAIPSEVVLMLSDLGDEEQSVSTYYHDETALERLKEFYLELSTNSNW